MVDLEESLKQRDSLAKSLITGPPPFGGGGGFGVRSVTPPVVIAIDKAVLAGFYSEVFSSHPVEFMYHDKQPTPGFFLGLRVPIPRPGDISDYNILVLSNTMDASTIIEITSGGVLLAGASFTITGGSTGLFGPLAGPFPVSGGSDVVFKATTSATAGAIKLVASALYTPS